VQVYSDFELKSGHRLDTKVLGYDSLAELVLQGTQLQVSLNEEPEGSGRLRIVRERQSMNPAAGYAGKQKAMLQMSAWYISKAMLVESRRVLGQVDSIWLRLVWRHYSFTSFHGLGMQASGRCRLAGWFIVLQFSCSRLSTTHVSKGHAKAGQKPQQKPKATRWVCRWRTHRSSLGVAG
jgi:hypothetical protein